MPDGRVDLTVADMFEKIVVGIDGTDGGPDALAAAVRGRRS